MVHRSCFVPVRDPSPKLGEDYQEVDYVSFRQVLKGSIVYVAGRAKYKIRVLENEGEGKMRLWLSGTGSCFESPLDSIGYNEIGRGPDNERGAVKVGRVSVFPYFTINGSGKLKRPSEFDVWVDTIKKIRIYKDLEIV